MRKLILETPDDLLRFARRELLAIAALALLVWWVTKPAGGADTPDIPKPAPAPVVDITPAAAPGTAA